MVSLQERSHNEYNQPKSVDFFSRFSAAVFKPGQRVYPAPIDAPWRNVYPVGTCGFFLDQLSCKYDRQVVSQIRESGKNLKYCCRVCFHCSCHQAGIYQAIGRILQTYLDKNPGRKEEQNKFMDINFGRPLYLNILKICFCFALVLFLNAIPLMHVCNAESDTKAMTVFRDSAGKELCRFKVELVVTPEEQSRGLMFRKDLRPDSGMLFINNSDEMRFFWMKNTYIPLDILFMNSRNEVKYIHYGAKPFDETTIFSQYPVQYVLEVNAGVVKKCKIRQGSKMSILKNPR
jgi:hypothetical protein